MLPSPPQPQPQSPLTGAKRCYRWIWDYMAKKIDDPMAERKADTLLVAASMIATMNYQTGISPPGGSYQDTRIVNGTIEYQAGQSIAAYVSPLEYKRFSIANTISFSLSMTTMFLFISGLSLKRRVFSFLLTASMFATITATTWSYKLALEATTPAHDPQMKSGWDDISRLLTGSRIIWYVPAGIAIIIFTGKHLKDCISPRNPENLASCTTCGCHCM